MSIQSLVLHPKHLAAVLSGVALLLGLSHAAAAEKASDWRAALTRDSRSALTTLYGKTSGAKAIGKQAVAVLVFPRVTKAGFVVGGQFGKGTLLRAIRPLRFTKPPAFRMACRRARKPTAMQCSS